MAGAKRQIGADSTHGSRLAPETEHQGLRSLLPRCLSCHGRGRIDQEEPGCEPWETRCWACAGRGWQTQAERGATLRGNAEYARWTAQRLEDDRAWRGEPEPPPPPSPVRQALGMILGFPFVVLSGLGMALGVALGGAAVIGFWWLVVMALARIAFG